MGDRSETGLIWNIIQQFGYLPHRLLDSVSPKRLRARMIRERERPDAFGSNRIVASYLFLYLVLVSALLIIFAALNRPVSSLVDIAPGLIGVGVCLICHLAMSSHAVRLTPPMGYLTVGLVTMLLCVLSLRNTGIIAPAMLLMPPIAAAALVLMPNRLKWWSVVCIAICLAVAGAASQGLIGTPSRFTHTGAVQTQAASLILSTIFLALLVTLFVIDRDITHSRYRRQNLELEEASRTRSDFLTMMSHELRTPMNAILGSLEILKRTDDPRSHAEMISLIEDAGYALTTQLDDLLDQSRIEAGKLSLVTSPVHIRDLIDRTMRLWRARADDNGLFMTHIQDQCDDTAIIVDRVRLQQVLSNLLSNAIKFTPQGGIRIRTTTEQIDDSAVSVIISVEDTGPGVPEEHLEAIFEPFTQSRQTHKPGSGLGLSISRRLIQLMGGGLSASNSPSGGARFEITLTAPLATATETKARETPAPDLENDIPIRILCVDDHPANLRIVTVLLETFGYDVHAASSGDEALEICARERFDVIFMDVLMPGIDGMETTRRLRNGESYNADTPIVALTANVMPDQILKYQASGMNGVVSKPIDSRILLSALERALSDLPFTDETIAIGRHETSGGASS